MSRVVHPTQLPVGSGHVSEEEYAGVKAALEARVLPLTANQIHTSSSLSSTENQIHEFLSVIDSLPNHGVVDLRAKLLSEMLSGDAFTIAPGDAGDREGASSSGTAS